MITYNNENSAVPIDFSDIKALGFKSMEGVHDSIFENEHGFPYKIYILRIRKVYEFDWDQVTRTVTLYKESRAGDGSNNELRVFIQDLKELQFLVHLLKKKDD